MKYIAGNGAGLKKFNQLDDALLAAVKDALKNEKKPGYDPKSMVFFQDAKGNDTKTITITVNTED